MISIKYLDLFKNNKDVTYLTSAEHEKFKESYKKLEKYQKFTSITLNDYLLINFNKDQFIIEWYANSPYYILIAKDNSLFKIYLCALKQMSKALLDKLLFDNGLIISRTFFEEKEEDKILPNIVFNN